MDTFAEIKKILEELLDLEDREITHETYLIQELGAESIDLLELAVAINSRFRVAVKDDDLFLTRFRQYVAQASQQMTDAVLFVAQKYPFLEKSRIEEIVAKSAEGPQIKIKDLISYIAFQSERV